jgi:hypothetical protein
MVKNLVGLAGYSLSQHPPHVAQHVRPVLAQQEGDQFVEQASSVKRGYTSRVGKGLFTDDLD